MQCLYLHSFIHCDSIGGSFIYLFGVCVIGGYLGLSICAFVHLGIWYLCICALGIEHLSICLVVHLCIYAFVHLGFGIWRVCHLGIFWI